MHVSKVLVVVALLLSAGALSCNALRLLPLPAAVTNLVVPDESAAPGAWSPPWFCHGLDCPEYSVVNSTDLYETRTYEEAKWASTKVDSLFYTTAVTTGFKRLFDYISGENEDKVKINMTAPVKTVVTPGDGPFCQSTFTVSFYVPEAHQDSPPTPTNPDVFIEEVPAQTFFVRSFGGFSLEPIVLAKADSFVLALKNEGLDVEEGSFVSAGYDPPFRLTKRHNEVWVAAGKAVDAPPQQ